MQTECLWGHQPKCMMLIVLIYLRAVRINQLKVKNWVCKYVPVLAPAPAFREAKARRGETFGDSCDARDRGGTHRQSQLWLSCTLNSQPVTRRIVGSLELYYRGKISSKLCEVCWRVENKYLKRVYALFPGHERQVSVTERRRVSDAVKVSAPGVTHLSRSRDNIVRAC